MLRFTIKCPHCQSHGIARGIEKVSPTSWLLDFQCDDVTCGHSYRTRIDMFPPETPIPRRARRETASLQFNE